MQANIPWDTPFLYLQTRNRCYSLTSESISFDSIYLFFICFLVRIHHAHLHLLQNYLNLYASFFILMEIFTLLGLLHSFWILFFLFWVFFYCYLNRNYLLQFRFIALELLIYFLQPSICSYAFIILISYIVQFF